MGDYSDAHIVVEGRIDILAATAIENDKAEKNIAFKNNARFRSCISKINSTLKDNTEDLDIVMSVYDILGYSKNYSMTSGSLWNCYRDKIVNINDNASDGKSFKDKKK